MKKPRITKKMILDIENHSNKSMANVLKYIEDIMYSDVFRKATDMYQCEFKDGVMINARRIENGWMFDVDCRR